MAENLTVWCQTVAKNARQHRRLEAIPYPTALVFVLYMQTTHVCRACYLPFRQNSVPTCSQYKTALA